MKIEFFYRGVSLPNAEFYEEFFRFVVKSFDWNNIALLSFHLEIHDFALIFLIDFKIENNWTAKCKYQ